MSDSIPVPEKPADAASVAARVDQAIAGKVAIVGACVGLAVLGFLVFRPLPWGRLPNVFGIFKESWLYLAITSAVLYSAIASVASRRGFPAGMFGCIGFGLVWKYTAALAFVPFNFSRLLIVYGTAGVTAYCLRRSVIYLRAARSKAIWTGEPPKTDPPR